jgi:hypothetical protein
MADGPDGLVSCHSTKESIETLMDNLESLLHLMEPWQS